MPLYFAYGSNMSAAVLARRLQRDIASFRRRRALLTHHRLAFEKVSSSDIRVGYANVTAALAQQVEGVLNELDDAALVQLDAIELVPQHYVRAERKVIDSLTGAPVAAQVYLAAPSWIRPGLRPLCSYIETLLGGADLLSERYVAHLRGTACVPAERAVGH